MPRGDIEVQHTIDDRWRLVVQGKFRTQKDAEREGRRIARILDVELFTRGLLGRLLRRDTVGGNDPHDVPG